MTTAGILRSLCSTHGRYRALHLSWIACFSSFLVWFDFAPFARTIGHQFHLSAGQLTTIGLCNLGLTVPARVLVGALLDRYGPRRVFPTILIFAAVPNTLFAISNSFSILVASRLALSIVGGGFVVGVRMLAEWWPKEEIGTAEGLYGGWGNLGGGVATVGLPLLADAFGGADGWRWSIGLMGVLAAAWGIVYLRLAKDTPEGSAWRPPIRRGALEVTTRASVFGLIALMVPVVGVMGVIAYRVHLVGVISSPALLVILIALSILLLGVIVQILRVNRPALAGAYPAEFRFPLQSVAICGLAYAVTFGGELAMLSMLPTFFGGTWKLGVATAGGVAGAFGLMNLVTRPAGGIASDVTGRRRATLVFALLGVAAGFTLMSRVNGAWRIGDAAVVCLLACACLQGGSGATFALVPQIAPRSSGQVAGIVGAYGNIGGTIWLFLLLYVSPQHLFEIIAASAAVVALLSLLILPDPASAVGRERSDSVGVSPELAVAE